MNMHTKAFGCDFEMKGDEAGLGMFSGHASTRSVDRGDDVVVEGAFGAVSPKKIRMLWQHKAAEPIGVWDVMREDDKGLYVEGRLALKTQRGSEAWELMKMGGLNEMSIGYSTTESEAGSVGGKRVRKLKKIKLYEVSLVSMAMNPEAMVSNFKHADGRTVSQATELATVRELERSLRDAGLSRKMAQLIVSEGLGGVEGYLKTLLREATPVSCKDTRIILEDGYRSFLKLREDTEENDDYDDENEGKSGRSGERFDNSDSDRNEDSSSRRSRSVVDPSVGQRDADGAEKSVIPKSLKFDPAFLAALELDLAISGD